ncbi:hypothetical protein A2U01_0081603, partial [Trifolium medium]|nr:hypothetical protein [Trifolium medium]
IKFIAGDGGEVAGEVNKDGGVIAGDGSDWTLQIQLVSKPIE